MSRLPSALGRAAAAAAVVAAAVGGCYGDMVSTREGADVAGDDPATAEPIPADLQLGCADAVETTDDGYHFEGSACLGCHNGSVGPEFSLGGTVYGQDGAPLAGAHLHLLDADGVEHLITTALNGNFYTTEPVALPGVAFVSSCPDVIPMGVYSTSADCNSCHDATDPITF